MGMFFISAHSVLARTQSHEPPVREGTRETQFLFGQPLPSSSSPPRSRGAWIFGRQPAMTPTETLPFTKCFHVYYFICFSWQPVLPALLPHFKDRETDQHVVRT